MKNKVLMWLLCISSYLMQLPFLVYFIILMCDVEISDACGVALMILSAILFLVALFLCLLNLLAAVLNLSKKVDNPYKLTMAVKLCLVPFYIINFVLWGLLVIGTLNIMLFWITPVFLVISISSTYLFMLATSIHNIGYSIQRLKETKQIRYIVYIILHFIFCIDVLTAIYMYVKERGSTVTQ